MLKPKLRRLPYPQILFLIVVLSVALTCGVRGGSEQARNPFADYRSRLQSGDTTAALNIVTTLSRDDTTLEAQMANFLLAQRSFERGDTQAALLLLDDGVPAELWDYAAWWRAVVHQRRREESGAARQWQKIQEDTSSVFAEDALYELALLASKRGDLDSLSRIVQRHERLATRKRRTQYELLLARTLAAQSHHNQAVERLMDLAVTFAHTADGRAARAQLNTYFRDYAHRPRTQTLAELERELETLAENKLDWGLKRVEEELKKPGWQSHNELLLFYKGRIQSGLGNHRAAIRDLQNHRSAYPASRFAHRALYFIGRSANLTDQDQLAVSSLNRVAGHAADTVLANRALETLGLLHMDRDRPRQAAAALQQWADMSVGRPTHPDALWRLGWAYWEARDFPAARLAWTRLSQLDIDSEYVPASLYWSARAAEQSGEVEGARVAYHTLDSVFTNSYYSVIRYHATKPETLFDLPLVPPSLDHLCIAPGAHTRKFGMLAAMQLSELALREWPAAEREQPASPGFSWWKVQLQYWQGKRLDAWLTMRSELGAYIRTGGARPDDFYRISYPLDHVTTIIKYSRQYNVDPYFVLGVITQESHFESSIVSSAGAIGMMQLMPGTASIQARKLGIPYSTSNLYQPEYNLRLGIAHLADLLRDWNGDTVLVLASYNAGPGAARRWLNRFGNRPRDEFIEKIPFRETRLFVKRITEHMAAYRRLYPDLSTLS